MEGNKETKLTSQESYTSKKIEAFILDATMLWSSSQGSDGTIIMHRHRLHNVIGNLRHSESRLLEEHSRERKLNIHPKEWQPLRR